MKKRIFVVALCLVCTVSAFIRLNAVPEMDDLFLMNVEALASGESNLPKDCLGKGSVDCPVGGVKVKYIMEGWSLDKDRY